MNRRFARILAPCLKATTLMASLVSGYYQRAFAGTCTGAAGTYNCSGAAAAGDTTQLISPGTPFTVTTLPGFGIDTSITGGNAFTLLANGDLRFEDFNTSTITGAANGISADNNAATGGISITTSGPVTGVSGSGIRAMNYGSGPLSISASGDIFGDQDGIYATQYGSGSLSITTSGTVTGNTGSGINAVNYGTDLSINAANVSGDDTGIEAFNFGSGALSISSSGTVTGDEAIWAFNHGTDLRISANDVSGSNVGIVAGNLGSGALSISTSGDVSGGAFGIYAINYGTDLSISTAGVSGKYVGIGALNYGSGSLSVTSRGDVYGGNVGIGAINWGSGSLSISASGDVTGDLAGIYAVQYGNGPLSVTTGGHVSSDGYGVITRNYGAQSSTSIQVGAASTVEGGYAGISAYASNGQAITISNSGTVRNTSQSPSDPAIIVRGGPATIELNPGSSTTGTIDLDEFDDMVTLEGSLDGSIAMQGGNDTFVQVGGSSLDGSVDGGADSDTLGFNDMGTLDGSLLDTTYLNFENLWIIDGSNTLTGTWDFSGGSIAVDAGSLLVDGSLIGTDVMVEAGGLLGGNGFITSDVVVYGTISPGNSIGTMEIDGSLSFMPGSTYIAELATGGRSDLIRVSGPVSISGATLQASLRRGLYRDGYNWTIIKADGGISGTFSTVRTNFTSSTIDLRQAVEGGSLKLYVERTPYASFGATLNDAAVGGGLDALLPSARGNMAELLMAMDFDMNPSQIGATLAGLNPEMYTSFPSSGFAATTLFTQTLNQQQQESRLAAAFPAEDRETPLWNAWFRALGSSFDSDSTDDIEGYDQTTGGLLIGADRTFGSASRAGLMLGYSDGDLDWDESAHSGTSKAKYIGLYGSSGWDDFYVDIAAGYNDLENSAERMITTPVLAATSRAGFDGSVWGGSLTAGYDFKPAGLLVGPVGSISYLSLDQDGFSEQSTSGVEVTVGGVDAQSLISRLGLRLGGLLEYGAWRFLPRGELSWLHQFEDDPVELTAGFAGYPNSSFTLSGASPAGDQGLLSLGLSAEYGENLTLYGDYSITGSDEQRLQLISLGLAWLF